MSSRQRGRIRIWKDDKGYGFITPEAGGADLFFHVTSITNSTSRELQGVDVTYTVGMGKDGKSAAENIRVAGAGYTNIREKTPRATRSQYARYSTSFLLFMFLFILPFFAGLAYLTLQHRISWFIPLIYLAMSFATFAAFYLDKQKALTGDWRTPESTLHALEFMGGWPGSLIAQRIFRHKISKPSYQFTFWIIVLLHLGALGYVIGTDHLPEPLLKLIPTSKKPPHYGEYPYY